jgi:hypothetical protein
MVTHGDLRTIPFAFRPLAEAIPRTGNCANLGLFSAVLKTQLKTDRKFFKVKHYRKTSQFKLTPGQATVTAAFEVIVNSG